MKIFSKRIVVKMAKLKLPQKSIFDVNDYCLGDKNDATSDNDEH